ncbi:MAG: CPBP family intramembrane glutamic endopeptidase, partial [Spirochaetota bacterium]
RWSTRAAIVIAALSVLIALVIRFNPGRRKLTEHYPQMRLAAWGPREIIVNIVGWAAYLFAYELMFRGFLLRSLLPYGVVLAVSVNIALYVAVHVPKGLSEAIAAVPFGALLCFLTIEYGTIWAAFILHLVLALANSLVAIAENPEMEYRWEPTRRGDRFGEPRA